IKNKTRSHVGIMSCVDIDDYIENRILKHENTLAEKEQKMMNLILQRRALIKPVLLTYPPVRALKDFITQFMTKNKALFTVKFENPREQHHIWEVKKEEQIQELQELFEKQVPKSYIADGHHRCSTAEYLHKSMVGKKHLDG